MDMKGKKGLRCCKDSHDLKKPTKAWEFEPIDSLQRQGKQIHEEIHKGKL